MLLKTRFILWLKSISRLLSNRQMITEMYWANVFNSTISSSNFLEFKSFTPGRWAASYSFLYILYRALNEFRPKNIIEFGLGETSKITIQYAKKSGSSLEIIEHDSGWMDAFVRKVPEDFDVKSFVKIHEWIVADSYKKGKKRNAYKGLEASSYNDKFDFFIIDGLSSTSYSRSEILDFIEHDKIADSFVIIFDDCQRVGQMETVEAMKTLFRKKEKKYVVGCYEGEKIQYLFTNPENKFLTTL